MKLLELKIISKKITPGRINGILDTAEETVNLKTQNKNYKKLSTDRGLKFIS